MTDAILVLHAGSSSLKVTEFTIGADGAPAAALNLAFEELTGDARFRATDPTGHIVDEHRWAEGEAPGHGGALDFLTDWLRGHDARLEIAAIGHAIPLRERRAHLGELDPARSPVLSCRTGLRSYVGVRILAQHGFAEIYNLSGGVAMRDYARNRGAAGAPSELPRPEHPGDPDDPDRAERERGGCLAGATSGGAPGDRWPPVHRNPPRRRGDPGRHPPDRGGTARSRIEASNPRRTASADRRAAVRAMLTLR